MQNIDQLNTSTSSVDSNDSEFGYGKMMDKVNNLITSNNAINQNNVPQEEVKEQELKEYKVLYRGVNFSGYKFDEYQRQSTNPKLQDAKHRQRRLFVKDSNERTLNHTKQTDYKSYGFNSFLNEQEKKCETISDLFRDVDDLANEFDSKLKLEEKLNINSQEQKISSYISPNGYKNAVKDLGGNYGNPTLSLSKSASIATQYADYGDSSSLKPNYRNNVNPKHRCVGQVDVFVFSKEEYDKISKDRDIDLLRSDKKVGGKCAVERENKEVLLNTKIDATNFIGSIPIVYPKLNYSKLQSDSKKSRYGVGYIADGRKLPKSSNLSKNSSIKDDVRGGVTKKVEDLAKSYVKNIGGRLV